MEKLSVSEVKKLTIALAGGINVADAMLDDGRISTRDLKHVPEVFRIIKGVAGIDLKATMPQVNDMDDAEKTELYETMREKLDIRSDTIETALEEGFLILLEAISAIIGLASLRAKFKA